jgi:dTDP-4-dehydrorhamnose 3,5-epimerase
MDNFEILNTQFEGLIEIKNKTFSDIRGTFSEVFRKENFNFLNTSFVQENYSISMKNVLRGLHFQNSKPQSKFIRCLTGKIFDVAVDLRKNSTTYLKHYTKILNENESLFLPKGFAHGFISLEDNTIVYYKTDEYYSPEYDYGIIWNDKTLKINWNLKELNITEHALIISEKDKDLPTFEEIKFRINI